MILQKLLGKHGRLHMDNKPKPKQYISWGQIDKAVDNMLKQIKASGKKYEMVAGVTRGGLVPAVILSHKLDLPMMALKAGDPILPIDLAKNTLIVDEIYDTGKTIESLKQVNPFTDFAVLYHNLNLPRLNYYGHIKQLDHWLVFPWEM